MGQSILFRGTEYASIKSMPPDVRAAYEADQQKLAEALPDVGQDAPGNQEPLSPAWAGRGPMGACRCQRSLTP